MFTIIRLFLFWRIGLFLITLLGSQIIPLIENGGIGAIGPNQQFNFLASWAQWDGGHFYNIAKYGYFSPKEYAFFPFFPLLIKLTSYLFLGNYLIAALVVTNVSFLIFLLIFYQLVKKLWDQKVAFATIVTFITFPTAYFAVAVYSEAPFLLLAITCLMFLEKRKILFAALAASFAGATRLNGLFLTIPIAFHLVRQLRFLSPKSLASLLYLPLSLLGFVLFSSYLYLKFENPLYFLSVQSSWQRYLKNPLETFYLHLFENLGSTFNSYLDLFLTLLFIITLLYAFKKLPLSWWLFSLLVVLVPISTGTLTSMPRYVLSAFPLFIIFGQFLSQKPKVSKIWWGVSLITQSALAVLFVNGYWTA